MAQFKTVAVAGASGRIGSAIVEGFLRRGGVEVRLLQRKGASKDASILAAFVKQGATIVEVDYSSDDHIVAALKGTDVLISAVSGAGFGETQPLLFKNAKAAGVKRILPSEFGSRPDVVKPEDSIVFQYKTGARQAVEATGLDYTYIATGLFVTDVYHEIYSFDFSKEPATVRWPADGSATQAGIDVTDVGQLVADTLLDHWDESRNAIVEITATTWTFNQSIELYKKFSGKDIKVEYVPQEQAAQEIAKDPSFATLGLQLALLAEKGKGVAVDSVVPKWFAGRKFLTLEDQARKQFGAK